MAFSKKRKRPGVRETGYWNNFSLSLSIPSEKGSGSLWSILRSLLGYKNLHLLVLHYLRPFNFESVELVDGISLSPDRNAKDLVVPLKDGWAFLSPSHEVRSTFSEFSFPFQEENEVFLLFHHADQCADSDVVVASQKQSLVVLDMRHGHILQTIPRVRSETIPEFHLPHMQKILSCKFESESQEVVAYDYQGNIETCGIKCSPIRTIASAHELKGKLVVLMETAHARTFERSYEVCDFSTGMTLISKTHHAWPYAEAFLNGSLVTRNLNMWIAFKEFSSDLYWGDSNTQEKGLIPSYLYDEETTFLMGTGGRFARLHGYHCILYQAA